METNKSICFVGDTHGDRDRTEAVISRAAERGCRIIVQVGDFGIAPEMRHSRPQTDGFETDVAAMCARNGVDLLLFADGNHDWHPWLQRCLRRYEVQVPNASAVPVEDTGRVRWVPRGTVLDVAGVKMLFCGGAPSIDPELRVPGLSWWPEEEITDIDVARSCAAGQVDVLVTHDISELIEIPGVTDDWAPGVASRHKVERIRSTTRPAWAFSGHYHRKLSAILAGDGNETRWEGLGGDCGPIEDQMFVAESTVLRKPLVHGWAR